MSKHQETSAPKHSSAQMPLKSNFAKDLLADQTLKLTPLLKQYLEIKAQVPDCLLFFRLGDFYELFYDDSVLASRLLEITLTSRNKNDPNPVPMCGVPYHSATAYIHKLVDLGYRVAIAEQTEEAQNADGSKKELVKREVVRIISSGTQLDPDALTSKSNNFIHAAELTKSGDVSWASCDYSTGVFYFGRATTKEQWMNHIQSQMIVEFLLPETQTYGELETAYRELYPHGVLTHTPAFYFDKKYASERIGEQFRTTKLDAVHTKLVEEEILPVGALIKYFQETQKTTHIPSVQKLIFWEESNRFELDPMSIRALELFPQKRTGRDVSLLSFIDYTATAMGGRLLKDYLIRPLKNLDLIRNRHKEVREFKNTKAFAKTETVLKEIYDLERLSSRVCMGLANARDLRALGMSIKKCEELAQFIVDADLKKRYIAVLHQPLLALSEKTLSAILEPTPLTIREGGIFNRGYDGTLDELIELTTNGEAWLAKYEQEEKTKTGISSLKVKFNKVFGYSIEITKSNLSSVPMHYVRKQTMVGGERYITEELKQFEEKILTSSKKRNELEYALFKALTLEFAAFSSELSKLSAAVAEVDVISSFARLAYEESWVEPELHEDIEIEIVGGKHPTVSKTTENFVANSVHLSKEKPFMLVTGPNMGGKSTVMRQTALIALLSQVGSFVPAKKARLGIVDHIFTRIGANDNIAGGSSTFMVEMTEMSYILRNATEKSLILLDEIGRGTSTFDGLSLAWSLASEIAENLKARTMFATHYHELTELQKALSTVQNCKMTVSITAPDKSMPDQKIVRFLYRLEPGGAERSYGILVARLAGVPENVLIHAQHILGQLESHAARRTIDPARFEQTEMNFLLNSKSEVQENAH